MQWSVTVRIWNDGSVAVSRWRIVDGEIERQLLGNNGEWIESSAVVKIERVLREDVHASEYEI